MQTLSEEQVRRLFEATAEHRLYPLWVLLATTRLRISEALALSWGDGAVACLCAVPFSGSAAAAWSSWSPKATPAGERCLCRRGPSSHSWIIACGGSETLRPTHQ